VVNYAIEHKQTQPTSANLEKKFTKK